MNKYEEALNKLRYCDYENDNERIELLKVACKKAQAFDILKEYLYIGGDSVCECIKLRWDCIDSISCKEDFVFLKEILKCYSK